MASTMTFQFLDVGMGDGTLVQIRPHGQPNDTLVLVDFGEEKSQFKVAYKDALTYLTQTIASNSKDRGLGYPCVDHLFITHPHADHFNKISELCRAAFPDFAAPLRFGRVRYGGAADEYPSAMWADLRTRSGDIQEMEDAWHSPIVDGVVTPYLTFGDRHAVKVYVLSVNYPALRADLNAKSIVLMFEMDGKRVILQGDAEKATEDSILTSFAGVPGFLRAIGLKLGHHGSKNATSEAWLQAVQPKAVFASADFVWHHPYCETICRVLRRGDAANRREELMPMPNGLRYVCGDGGKGGAYHNNAARVAVCMNLWYWCVTDQRMIEDSDEGKKEIAARAGWTWGVQWALMLVSGGRTEITRTDTAVPFDEGKAGPPWACAPPPLALSPPAPAWTPDSPRRAAAAAAALTDPLAGDGPPWPAR